jgi:WD40 repeat protein
MEVLAIDFSPNEKYLAVKNADTTIQIWILDSGLIPTGNSFTLHDEVNQSLVHSLLFFRNSNVFDISISWTRFLHQLLGFINSATYWSCTTSRKSRIYISITQWKDYDIVNMGWYSTNI